MLIAICNGSTYKKAIEISKEQMNDTIDPKKLEEKD
jgi:hypothetical protein